ncbi:hypothetical protein CDAR_316221 [Caerostris darwini]|uniref:Uncharacterized protein n=1 Tax=Caerostris darwini TaxID=1538125 RepID=A0AAV4Q9Z3_9ARAC|nr:hypothetical protein CDAR_316221 [Caerostris darwini]
MCVSSSCCPTLCFPFDHPEIMHWEISSRTRGVDSFAATTHLSTCSNTYFSWPQKDSCYLGIGIRRENFSSDKDELGQEGTRHESREE